MKKIPISLPGYQCQTKDSFVEDVLCWGLSTPQVVDTLNIRLLGVNKNLLEEQKEGPNS